MLWSLIALSAVAQAAPQGLGSPGGAAMLRFGCSQSVIERLDPLVNPGENPSPHLHQVVGGNAFNVSMPNTDISQVATCTSCSFTEDFSNYWTANVYYKAKNGSFKMVPQIPNEDIGADQGGVTVYYSSPGPSKVTAFKPGFRMLAGDSTRRTSEGLGRNMQSCFRCFTSSNFGGNTASPCFDNRLDTETFPATPCPGGIRSNIIFPLCWDGKNLDSPDHSSHVAQPQSGATSFDVVGAACPSSHPVKIPQVMLEIVWDTSGFNNKADWPATGQPLYLSNGDNTGYGQHADYVFGWKGTALQTAMDGGCFGPTCKGLTTQALNTASKCLVKNEVAETTSGWLDELPGNPSGMRK